RSKRYSLPRARRQQRTESLLTPPEQNSTYRLTRMLLVYVGLACVCLAQAASAFNQQPLSTLIDGLQNKYSRMQGLEADFVQLYYTKDGRALRESGHLQLKRPGKARWDYQQPERKLFVSDGKKIFFYVAGDRYATQSTIKESADPQIPFLFLLGRGNLRRDFSTIEIAGDEPRVVSGGVVLRLSPKRAPEEFKELLVEVSPTTFEVRRMVIFERSGGRMDFLLSNIRENYVAPDSVFSFTPPPGVALRKAE